LKTVEARVSVGSNPTPSANVSREPAGERVVDWSAVLIFGQSVTDWSRRCAGAGSSSPVMFMIVVVVDTADAIEAEQIVHQRGGVGHGVRDRACVHVHREGNTCVAEDVGHNLGWDPCLESERRVRVAQIMEKRIRLSPARQITS
jgi:hypothetical protein